MILDWKSNRKLYDYGIEIGDVLIHKDETHKVTKKTFYNNDLGGVRDGVVEVYRKSVNGKQLIRVFTIERDRIKELMERLHPQAKLTNDDLLTLVQNIDNNYLNHKSPTIVYAYKKGKSYVIKKVSIEALKMNFDSIVNSARSRNFYWLEAPAIEYTKQAWYSMSKRQKHDFEDFLLEVE